MRWGPTAAILSLPPSSYTALETSTVKGPTGGEQEKQFPIQYLMCGICVHVCISDLCLCTCANMCSFLYYTSTHMQMLPFYDHVGSAAYTTTPWLPYCDRGHLSAIWGLFCHSLSAPCYYPISFFPRGTLSLLPSAGTACILIN